MKNRMNFFLTICLLLSGYFSKAQGGNPNKVEMADVLHQNGKIYLVVLVLVTIFAGIIFLLVRIERKLYKLEKNHS
jgi:hypothetical protein